MKTKEQKDKAAKKGKQSLISVTRRFKNFSISKIDLTPPPIILTPILAQWWIWRPPPFLQCQDNAYTKRKVLYQLASGESIPISVSLQS